MTASEAVETWLAACAALRDRHAAMRPRGRALIADVRRTLAETYLQLANAPPTLLDDFADIEPEHLDDCGTEFSFDIMKGNFRWLGSLTGERDALRTMGGQLRALDAALHFLVGRTVRPSNPTEEWRAADLPAFVVPRRRPRRISLSAAGTSFKRNALVYHRVLPAALKGCELCFEWLDEHSEPLTERWTRPLGAAMFRPFGLRFAKADDEGGFAVSANDPAPPAAVVAHQLFEADRDRCFALVWPEVSMPPERQRQVKETLSARSADLERYAFSVDLLVLGSWHEGAADDLRNVARIVDSHGEEIAAHHKVMPYRLRRAKPKAGEWFPRREAIVRGEQLTVLLTEDKLVAVIICRDLCDRCGYTPFDALDVDLVLVPSLGNQTTIDSHAVRSESLHIQFGTQVFVAQHPQLSSQLPAGGYGWVLKPSAEPRSERARAVQMSPYDRYPQLPPQEEEPIPP